MTTTKTAKTKTAKTKTKLAPKKDTRILVQSLIDRDLKDWIEKRAADRDLKVGAYLRVLLRWCREIDLKNGGKVR